jgi:ribosomal protein S9
MALIFPFIGIPLWIIANWNKLPGIFNGIINGVKGALNGAGDFLYNAGKNIIHGLWNGISGMAGWLYNNVMGFIRNNVPGPVLKLLGIHSPSTLFAEYGKYTMMGFGQGVTNQAAAVSTTVTKTMQGIAQSGKQALSAGLSGSGMSASVSSSMLGAVGGGGNSTTNNKSQQFAPNITINVAGGGGNSGMSYAASQAVLQMQNRALFT